MPEVPFESIAQYYFVYTPILWTAYFVIVWRIATRVRNSHFFGLVTLNGMSDLTLCILGNFFYRWPRSASFKDNLYYGMQGYSFVLSIFYFLVFHLHYAEFILTLFMAFNAFTTLTIPKYYNYFWRHCFYKYIILFVMLPVFLFLNVLVSQSRFRQVPVGDNYYYYYLLPSSYLPQYVSHEAGAAFLSVTLAITFFLFFICFVELLMHLCQKFEHKLERCQIENLLIALCYSALRTVFLVYEHLRNSYKANGNQIGAYWASNTFPVMSDLLTLSPPLFLLLISSQVRQLLFPCFGHQKKNRVHFDERANEIRNASEHESEGITEEHQNNPNTPKNNNEQHKNDEELKEEREDEQELGPVTSRLPVQQHDHTDVQKIVGHSFGADRQKTPKSAESKRVSISVEKSEELEAENEHKEDSRPPTSSQQNLAIPPERASTQTINETHNQLSDHQ